MSKVSEDAPAPVATDKPQPKERNEDNWPPEWREALRAVREAVLKKEPRKQEEPLSPQHQGPGADHGGNQEVGPLEGHAR
jgi:hypothetical protein